MTPDTKGQAVALASYGSSFATLVLLVAMQLPYETASGDADDRLDRSNLRRTILRR